MTKSDCKIADHATLAFDQSVIVLSHSVPNPFSMKNSKRGKESMEGEERESGELRGKMGSKREKCIEKGRERSREECVEHRINQERERHKIVERVREEFEEIKEDNGEFKEIGRPLFP